MTYGNFYYGKGGFQYKKMNGGGVRRTLTDQIGNYDNYDIYNKYVPGSGVGATSIATRRAKLIHATSCYGRYKCGNFIIQNGLKPQQTITSLDIASQEKEQQPRNQNFFFKKL